MCFVDDTDGLAAVLSSRNTRARKVHKCTECRKEILIGDTYLRESTAFDGSAQTHKICPQCIVKRDWLNANCGGFAYGLVLEDYEEHNA